LHRFPLVQDLDLSCFCEVTVILSADFLFPAPSSALYVLSDFIPVFSIVVEDVAVTVSPAHFTIPVPSSLHVHLIVTPSVVPVCDFVHVIVGLMSSFQ
jgi:hypothetical protein